MFKKIIRMPLVIFVLVGAAVFALEAYLSGSAQVPVELNATNRAMFTEQLEMLTGTKATKEDVAKIEQDYIREEILFREALEAGLHLNSGEVRELLIEAMQYQLTGALSEPTETELVQYYLENIQNYQIEAAYSFQHVFFEEQPQAQLLEKIQGGEEILGDEFWRGRLLPDYGISMIRGMFGQAFLAEIEKADMNTWIGPIKSMLGWHFITVLDYQEVRPLTFEQSRMQVSNDYNVDMLNNKIHGYIQNLGDKYEVIQHVK
ncbi:peptidyl-prolyl cis-trans isomerase [Paraglaciecola sp. 2405UD69-4]|uniref:peptidylprolyl isomerase n=1 Tax=Paraglaciecola sp. 2405UD69-4 TaxID=3391836 RepID=UPI0039C9A4F2